MRSRRYQLGGEEIHLFYRDIHHTPFRYYGPLQLIQFVRHTDRPSEAVFRVVHDLSPQDDIDRFLSQLEPLDETERETVVRARIGQGRFREELLTLWGGCAVTGIASPELLKASHIKPWRFSDNDERLSRFNGLILLPQYDHLFDRGYITFDDAGRLEPSPAIETLPPDKLGIEMDARLRRLSEAHLPFLAFHRREVFLAEAEVE